jgi:hypothetical protein
MWRHGKARRQKAVIHNRLSESRGLQFWSDLTKGQQIFGVYLLTGIAVMMAIQWYLPLGRSLVPLHRPYSTGRTFSIQGQKSCNVH